MHIFKLVILRFQLFNVKRSRCKFYLGVSSMEYVACCLRPRRYRSDIIQSWRLRSVDVAYSTVLKWLRNVVTCLYRFSRQLVLAGGLFQKILSNASIFLEWTVIALLPKIPQPFLSDVRFFSSSICASLISLECTWNIF